MNNGRSKVSYFANCSLFIFNGSILEHLPYQNKEFFNVFFSTTQILLQVF
jgi:hypothetical protein